MENFVLFTTPTCFKCPAVKQYLETVDMQGEYIDAATKAGLDKARELGVAATPTVIFYDLSGNETKRVFTLEEVKTCCQ